MQQLPRANYKGTWEQLASTYESALKNVAWTPNEEWFRRSAELDFERIKAVATVKPTDTVLEIGCGVGRLGQVIAPQCAKWIGTDVSANMLAYARERLSHLDNIELLETSGFDLCEVPDESIDVVYCPVVFMHLDEWDRYSYVLESRRVLRPGGTLYVDNFNLASADGWLFFEEHRAIPPELRATQMSKSSTRQELQLYFEHAAFDDIRIVETGRWLAAAGTRSTRPLPEVSSDEAPAAFRLEYATLENFDEAGYLAANSDVAEAVASGAIPSARSHFESHGLAEKRTQWWFAKQQP